MEASCRLHPRDASPVRHPREPQQRASSAPVVPAVGRGSLYVVHGGMHPWMPGAFPGSYVPYPASFSNGGWVFNPPSADPQQSPELSPMSAPPSGSSGALASPADIGASLKNKRRKIVRDSSTTTSTSSLDTSPASFSPSDHGSPLSPEAESEIDESILAVMEVPTVGEDALPSPEVDDEPSIPPLVNEQDQAWSQKEECVVSDLVLDDFNARDLLSEWGI
mmetsp:Transcript_5889/g.14147  ORF Transcript_5889/g.14147 Transcript_5889/m.14147 type:complete len:221 (+) Transcript_5889:510-1172(+)